MIATDNVGNEISVNPNWVRLNDAGASMLVATYPEKELDRGNQEPVFINFHCLHLKDEDKETLENIFKLERAMHYSEKKSKNKRGKSKNKREKLFEA